ncbi:hypothetical protein QN277_012191 [Acacia crassicarpa]|uniref:SHSP domain-containing protein n=1 Tax=Acacia crassicarpa TaxID=499986 RepID=A0AAE1TDG8_9FABA|nr:hypothetical protein QN277_012191 [Acacia crassicarpa]
MDTIMALEPRNRFYEVFEPHCKWNTFETLDIDVKGFKMEHIKVQINHNKGMLVIHGERPLGSTVNNNKWIRFHKTIKLSEDSNPSEIRAKFSDGVLSIQVPKQVKELVSDLAVGEEDSHHRRDSSVGWGIVKMNNWGTMKAAVLLAITVVTVGVMIGAKSAAPPPVFSNKEDVVVDRAVKGPYNEPKPGFNFRFQ